MKIILASQSPARLELLKRIGIKDISVIPADIDESALKKEKPKDLAVRLSIEKASKIATNYSDQALIIAADTVVCVGTRELPKPHTNEDVRYCLSLLSGRRHSVYTGVTIINSVTKEIRTKFAKTIVRVKTLTNTEIEEFIASKEGLNKAGGYSIQGLMQCYIPFINGQVSNVIGLPLFETKNMLVSLGYKF